MNSDRLFCTLLDATFDDAMVLFSSQKHDIEGVLEIILHQQSTQKNVQECLEKFRALNLNDLETICNTDDRVIENLITKYAKIKTKRIKVLFEEILSYFLDFENFKENVDLSWFENIKGISRVNAEMILLKICERNILPVTTPLKKILEFLGYEFESHDEAQEWLCSFDADIIKKKFDFEDSEKILLLFVIAAEIFYEKFTKNGKFTSASQKILNPLLKD